MAKVNYPGSPQSVPNLDAELREKIQDRKDDHAAFVAKGRKERTEKNPHASKYDGGFTPGHPNTNIIPAYQQSQSDLAISLENTKKSRKR